MTDLATIFDKAADLIEAPDAWTQLAYARTAKGAVIGPNEEAACAWCTLGAFFKVTDDDEGYVDKAQEAMLSNIPYDGLLSEWNDAPERTQAEVVSTLRTLADKYREETGK